MNGSINFGKTLPYSEFLSFRYSSFTLKNLNLGHLENIHSETMVRIPIFLLTHYCISFTGQSTTTKVRVALEAKAKATLGFRLTDCFLFGPNLQTNLLFLLKSFILFEVALTAKKLEPFEQIGLSEADSDTLRILWRFEHRQSIDISHTTRVAYCVASSSDQSTRCLLDCSWFEGVSFGFTERNSPNFTQRKDWMQQNRKQKQNFAISVGRNNESCKLWPEKTDFSQKVNDFGSSPNTSRRLWRLWLLKHRAHNKNSRRLLET